MPLQGGDIAPGGPRCLAPRWDGVISEILLLLRNTDDFPKLSLTVGNNLRKNRRCHPRRLGLHGCVDLLEGFGSSELDAIVEVFRDGGLGGVDLDNWSASAVGTAEWFANVGEGCGGAYGDDRFEFDEGEVAQGLDDGEGEHFFEKDDIGADDALAAFAQGRQVWDLGEVGEEFLGGVGLAAVGAEEVEHVAVDFDEVL